MEQNRNSMPIIQPDDVPQNIKDHVSAIAWKTTRQAIRSLSPKLRADLNRDKSLPELVKLLIRRLHDEVYLHVMIMEVLKIYQPFVEDSQLSQFVNCHQEAVQQWAEMLEGAETPLVRRVYTIFLRQLKEYRKKYKEDMSQTIIKAIKQDTRSICRLLEWDKSWIQFDFIHNEIARRGYLYGTDSDKRFFEMVGDAIRKKPHVKQEMSGYFGITALEGNRLSLYEDNYRVLKLIHTELVKTGAFDSGTEEEGNPLDGFKYFTRYLKRHNIL